MDGQIVAFGVMTVVGLSSWYLGLGVGFLTSLVIGQVCGFLYQTRVVKRNKPTPNSAVFITGTSSGIGFHASLNLAKKGMTIFAGVRKMEDADALKKECPSGSIIPIMVDVTNEEQVIAASQKVEKELQEKGLKLLGVVNNAGYPETSVLELIPLEKLRAQLEVNVVGQVRVSQHFLPLLRKYRSEKQSPRLVFISSGVGWMTVPAMGAYCASKHAIEAVADAFRMELQSWAIDVAIVEPGSIRSRFNKTSKETMSQNLGASNADGELQRYNRMCAELAEKQIIMGKLNFGTEFTDEAIEAALLDSVPLTRYRAGYDSLLGMPIIIHLPDRIVDFIFSRFFRK